MVQIFTLIKEEKANEYGIEKKTGMETGVWTCLHSYAEIRWGMEDTGTTGLQQEPSF